MIGLTITGYGTDRRSNEVLWHPNSPSRPTASAIEDALARFRERIRHARRCGARQLLSVIVFLHDYG
jgi:hypothetical protein